jgi:hypothetical protein
MTRAAGPACRVDYGNVTGQDAAVKRTAETSGFTVEPPACT